MEKYIVVGASVHHFYENVFLATNFIGGSVRLCIMYKWQNDSFDRRETSEFTCMKTANNGKSNNVLHSRENPEPISIVSHETHRHRRRRASEK